MDFSRAFNDPSACINLIKKLEQLLDSQQLRFMEVCGTHTVSIFHSGLHDLLPKNIIHLSGPGCPVCVTHDAEVATFLKFAHMNNIIIATFGDVLRIPSPDGASLKHAMAQGARIEIIYSPLDALTIAKKNPHDIVILLGIGFETTAPTIAATIIMAEQQQIQNLLLFSCHKLVPPALKALLDDNNTQIDAFLLPGHVSTILGLAPYSFLSDYKTPGIIAGFDASDILFALVLMTEEIIQGQFTIKNAYQRAVNNQGNPKARAMIDQVFVVSDALWRGMGTIKNSGLTLAPKFAHRDALIALNMTLADVKPIAGCRCGDVLKGIISPTECVLFGKKCTPAKPIGPCMVSTEGSCAAYYKYGLGN